MSKKIDPNGWMVTFSDLLTLLLTFFVLLLTMSSMDTKQIKKALGFFTGLIGPLHTGQRGEIEEVGVTPPLVLPIKTSLFEGGVMRKNEMEIERVKAGIKKKGLEKYVDVKLQKRGLVLTFAEKVLFESGSAEISPLAIHIIHTLSPILKESPLAIRVEGHTDNMPINTALYPSNWELSTARAVNVLKHLVEKEGFPPEKLSVAGYGDSKPLFPNNTSGRRAKNRRIEFVLFSR